MQLAKKSGAYTTRFRIRHNRAEEYAKSIRNQQIQLIESPSPTDVDLDF